MTQQNTYSLRRILESDLDPHLCKLMLHEIKSPLLEHSFQLTTDDEVNGGEASVEYSQAGLENSGTFRQGPAAERGATGGRGVRPGEATRGDAKWERKLEEISVVHSTYEPSRRDQRRVNGQAQNMKASQAHFILDQHSQNRIENGLVSPLQHQSNSKPSLQDHIRNEQSLSISESPSQLWAKQQRGQGVATWCGEIFDPQDAFEKQVELPGRRENRKRIFKTSNQIMRYSIHQTIDRPVYNTFEQAIDRLHPSQPHMVKFLHFLASLLPQLRQVSPFRHNLTQNQPLLYRMFIDQNPLDYETRQTINNRNRIINRLHSTKMSEALREIISRGRGEQARGNAGYSEGLAEDIGGMMQVYSRAEDVIEGYVLGSDAVRDLSLVYDCLFEDEIRGSVGSEMASPRDVDSKKDSVQKSVIDGLQKVISQTSRVVTQPSRPQPSLQAKLQLLLSGHKISPHEYCNIRDLNYIWRELQTPGAYSPTSRTTLRLNKQKFINELCRNDILVHECLRAQNENSMERKLMEMGFIRNKV